MWREFDYQADGEPARNHIVNKLEKSIGHYEWKYHNGRLLRRDRFNADGTLRFYYAAMKYDPQGHPLEWSKFDRNGRKIGVKSWLYEN